MEEEKEPDRNLQPGKETILIAEDEPVLLELIESVLEPLGYNVLTAENGVEALRVSREHNGTIDILLTDVIMPEMNGRQLADAVSKERPGTKVVYMSGYTDDIIAPHGILEPDVYLVKKPLTPQKLTSSLREALNGHG